MHCARGPEPVAAIHLALGFIYLFENQHVKEEVVNWSNKYTIDAYKHCARGSTEPFNDSLSPRTPSQVAPFSISILISAC